MSVSCKSNSDCDFNFYCQLSSNLCEHKGLWPPTVLDVITYLLLPLIIGIGSVGGVGGGIAKVPMIILLLNYPSQEATFISYCVLSGSCLANSIILMFKRHPTKERPLIDYTIVLILSPMVLLGTNTGIFLNIALPEIADGILFLMFLFIISPYLFKKGKTLYTIRQQEITTETNKQHKEIEDEKTEKHNLDNKSAILDQLLKSKDNIEDEDTNEKRKSKDRCNSHYLIEEKQNESTKRPQAKGINPNNQDVNNSMTINCNKNNKNDLPHEDTNGQIINEISINKDSHISNDNLNSTNNDSSEVYQNEEVQNLLLEESKQFPVKKILLLILIFLSVEILVFLCGGKDLGSFVGITSCSTWYWVVCFLIVCVAFLAFFVVRRITLKWEKDKKIIIEKYSLENHFDQDLELSSWDRFVKIAFSGLLAGILAARFGVGAGLALVPILLSFELNPQVAAATSGFNYFFISLTTIIQVFTNGHLSLSQIGWFSFLSFVGGFIIAKFIYYLVSKYKANYAIVFFVFGLAILNIVSFLAYLSKKVIMHGWNSLLTLKPFCEQ